MKLAQEKMKILLTDTVSLLCKNGLAYSNELTIQGLLAVSVDNEIFVVQINEAFSTSSEPVGFSQGLDVGKKSSSSSLNEFPNSTNFSIKREKDHIDKLRFPINRHAKRRDRSGRKNNLGLSGMMALNAPNVVILKPNQSNNTVEMHIVKPELDASLENGTGEMEEERVIEETNDDPFHLGAGAEPEQEEDLIAQTFNSSEVATFEASPKKSGHQFGKIKIKAEPSTSTRVSKRWSAGNVPLAVEETEAEMAAEGKEAAGWSDKSLEDSSQNLSSWNGNHTPSKSGQNNRGGRSRHSDGLREKSFACQYEDCQKAFFRKDHLIRHQRMKHGKPYGVDNQNIFFCPIQDCGRMFYKSSSMNRHINELHSFQASILPESVMNTSEFSESEFPESDMPETETPETDIPDIDMPEILQSELPE